MLRFHSPLLSVFACLSLAALLCHLAPDARCDTRDDQKRALLAHVHRVVVIPAFFGTDTLTKADKLADNNKPKAGQDTPSNAPAPTPPNRKPEDARLLQNAETLRKLQDDVRATLPQRLARRAGLEIVSAEELASALKDLQLTPEKMFENEGRMKGTKFPLPLPQAVRDVAKICHADAVVLGVLDEPRRANSRYFFDPLYGFSYETGYVETHAGFYLMLPDATEGLHGYMRVRNPLSRVAGHPFVLADWIDAQDLMIENMMDEWTYYLPRKP